MLAKKFDIYILAPSLPFYQTDSKTTNRTFIFTPNGQVEYQDNIFMTRFEDEDWNIKAGEQTIKVFKIKDFRFSISTCFDVEFAALAIAAAQAGAQVLFAPSCTETMKGLNRVHLGFTDDGVLLQGSLNQADLFCYELDL